MIKCTLLLALAASTAPSYAQSFRRLPRGDCQSRWSDESSTTQIVGDKILEIANPPSNRIVVRDLTGRALREIKLPRAAQQMSTFLDSPSPDVIGYLANGGSFYYDVKHDREVQTDGHTGSSRSQTLSDGRHIVSGTLQTFANKDGAIRLDVPPGYNIDGSFSAKGFVMAIKTDGGGVRMINTSSGQAQEIPLQASSVYNLKNAFGAGDQVYFAQDGRWVNRPSLDAKLGRCAGVTNDGRLMYVSEESRTTLLDPKTNKTFKIEGIPANGNAIENEFLARDGTVRVLKTMGEQSTVYTVPRGFDLTGDGEYTFGVENGKLTLNTLAGRKLFDTPASDYMMNSRPTNVRRLGNGRFQISLGYSSGGGVGSLLFDQKDGKLRPVPVDTAVDGSLHLIQGHWNKRASKTVCLGNHLRVEACNCEVNRNQPLDAHVLDQTKKVLLATMCASDEAQNWRPLLGKVDGDVLTREQTALYIKKFQKTGGYQDVQDEQALTAILRSDLVDEAPNQILTALQVIQERNPNLVDQLYDQYDLASRLKADPKNTESVCQSNRERAQVQEFLRKQTDIADAEPGRDQPIRTREYWDHLRPYQNELQKMSPQEHERLAEGIAEHLIATTEDRYANRSIPTQKTYYLARKYADGLFGDPVKPATDLVVTAVSGSSTPSARALISGDPERPAGLLGPNDKPENGFQIQNLPLEPRGQEQFGVSWRAHGRTFNAVASPEKVEGLEAFAAKTETFPYDKLKTSGAPQGLVFIGDNMRSNGAKVLDQYQAYYKQQGFTFEPPRPVDTHEFMGKKISSGEVTYMVKEAHSDGDDRNVAAIPERANVLVGRKGGETVYLLAPDPKVQNRAMLSNEDLGRWVHARPGDKHLVYFNTSCNATEKVIAETTTVRDTRFHDIGAMSLVDEFENRPDHPLHVLVDGFRHERSFSQMSAQLRQTDLYKQGSDRFLFPNDDDYAREIRARVNQSHNYDVTITDDKGQKVNFADQVN